MADISEVINVSLLPPGRTAARDNLNVTAIITGNQGVLSSAERARAYRTASAVASDFGSASQETAFANSFFATRPNPVNAGGILVIGYHRASEEDLPATAAVLRGGLIEESEIVPVLQTISDGSFSIDIDATTVAVADVDFRSVTTLAGAVSLIDSELTGATATLDDIGIVITSDTTGATSTLTLATEGASGTFIGELLGLSAGTGAVLTQGAAVETLPAETEVEALDAVRGQFNFFGACFVNAISDVPAVASWAGANGAIIYETFTGTSALEVDISNPVWSVKLAGQSNFRCLYSKSGNRRLSASYMARNHTVNFGAENSAITMHLKELSVAAEDYSDTELLQAKTVGLDVYTTIKDAPVVLTSGANDYVDNVYNLIGYIDAVQTDAFNFLRQAGTKSPQTTQGVNALVGRVEQTTRGFVRAGVFSPGAWTSPDGFGNRNVFLRSIEQNGFYFLAGSLADQSPSDRAERKSPVIQGAVKNAGAIHSADVVINFNL